MQLLAAWFTGLIIVNGSFLTAATQINSPTWAAGALVVASIVNVPIVLFCVFRLLTRYRPEMLSGKEYLEYQAYVSLPSEVPDISNQSREMAEEIIQQLGPESENRREPIEKIIHNTQVEWVAKRMGGNRTLSELYKRPNLWSKVVAKWGDDQSFKNNVSMLIELGVVTMEKEDFKTCRLTDFGKKVAKLAESLGLLFAQQKGKKEIWEEGGL